MSMLQKLSETYGSVDCRDLGSRQLEALRDALKRVPTAEINSAEDGRLFVGLLRKFREAVGENDKLHGGNYPQLLNSLLSVGEDGLYSNSLRFIFELIQNVDDCDFTTPDDCKLDMRFDFNTDEIVLSYNEVGFTPFNVFAITGIAEAAKNVSATKNEIGEKGIGFKSVFGVAREVLIQSGWFSFKLYKDNFTIPVIQNNGSKFCPGTRMTLYVPGRSREIYKQIRDQYCRKEALFSKNPLLFLNKLTSLRLYYDTWRSMEFKVSRAAIPNNGKIYREDDVKISVNLRDHDSGSDREMVEEITCTRYTYPVIYSPKACQARYGQTTLVGSQGGKGMLLQAVLPYPEDVKKVGNGGLYSFLPTQLAFTVPIVCHAPFKLDASREFVDPQDDGRYGGNLWFKETSQYLAELLDHVFPDWARTVKQNIVYYVPEYYDSLIAKNNGKERCLSNQNAFKGSHFLMLPLFKTVDGQFKRSSEIFCFASEEKIFEPVLAAKLISASKALFMLPEDMNASRFGIAVERNIYDRLLILALNFEQKTGKILEYLDAAGYEYSEKKFPKYAELMLTSAQIECIMRCRGLADIMLRISNDAVRNRMRPRFSIKNDGFSSIFEVLYDSFELNETPKAVENYMTLCKGRCKCIDIPKNRFLACQNGIALSRYNPLSSFAAFCYEMDSSDTFAIRIKLKEASKQLDQCVEDNSGSASDYIHALRNIRLTVKDSLGANGYKSYLDLILKSGTDHTRFVHELLQNADDCVYPEGQIPSFKLSQHENVLVTEYNEIGFTRANIRSITAIGESTKNSLLKGDVHSIGEKGVGFKSVFATFSEVKIYSGEYNFALTDKNPTIPRLLKEPQTPVNGTKMEMTLKEHFAVPALKAADILELCLCLRQLKELDINGHKVSIVDTGARRTITIDKRPTAFIRYIHAFQVTDQRALAARSNGTRAVSRNQQIVCYVPEKASAADYPLYVGLPTKHRIRIPMAIDAPFELTTSRETIEADCLAWNSIVKKEMYEAIIEVIHARKSEDRANALRFARFSYRMLGNTGGSYVNDLSDYEFLNSYDYLSRLRTEKLLPTFHSNVFVAASDVTAFKYPEAATLLIEKLLPGTSDMLRPETIINPVPEGVSKEQRERIEVVFKALACKEADFARVFPMLVRYAESFIEQENFRTKLYEYLQETPAAFQSELCELKIIPVYGLNGGVEFISWVEDGIYVKKDALRSDKAYHVLNERLLSKSMCEKMLGVNINEMNAEWEKSRYKEHLREVIRGRDVNEIYSYLLTEFENGMLTKNGCQGVLLELKEYIPLKNELGEITDTELFLCNQPTGYFAVEMLQRIIVHKECARFAEFIRCRNLSEIYYDNIDYFEPLTADDVEALTDDYFTHSEEILRGFYRDEKLSDELLKEYGLEYLGMGRTNESYSEYSFPTKPILNRTQLRRHVVEIMKNPVTIFSAKIERSVLKGKRSNGETFDLSGENARNSTLKIYTPEGSGKIAFCQMCRRPKPYMLMEVNNLELKPKFYYPQTRIALCLECSKRFEALREKNNIREAYLNEIRSKVIQSEGIVEIPVGRENKLTFTATHLAEVQEILKRLPH